MKITPVKSYTTLRHTEFIIRPLSRNPRTLRDLKAFAITTDPVLLATAAKLESSSL